MDKAADFALATAAENYLKVNTAGRIEVKLPENSLFTKLPVVKVKSWIIWIKQNAKHP
jgi:hypothetical protein